jgi:hypothetical protein
MIIFSIWDQLCRSCCLLVAQILHTGLHSGSKQQQQQQDSWFVVTGWLPEDYVQAPITSLARRWSICNILGWWARIKMCRTMHTTLNHQEQHYCNKSSECSNEKLHKLSVPGNTPCTTSAGMHALSPLVGAIILQLHHTLLQLTTCNFVSTFTWVQEQKQTPQREGCSRLPPQCHCLQLFSFFPSLCFVIKPEKASSIRQTPWNNKILLSILQKGSIQEKLHEHSRINIKKIYEEEVNNKLESFDRTKFSMCQNNNRRPFMSSHNICFIKRPKQNIL